MEKPTKLEYIPKGFRTFSTNCGIKDDSSDLGVVFSERMANAAALFTRNAVVGEPIKVGKKHIVDGKLQAIVVNSKNANVATGKQGYEKSLSICEKIATEIAIPVDSVLPSSTGVISRQLPVEKVLNALDNLSSNLSEEADFVAFSKSIMTTDTFPKFVSAKVGNASIVGVAKGSGMIEPNMATMLSYFFTDAELPSDFLHETLQECADKSFNCLSVDTDTSTSDTLVIMANGLAGAVDKREFKKVFLDLCVQLTCYLARDGEGATKLFKVTVENASTAEEARRVGKSIINSPLVKTMIYRGDPNWGRVLMAIGKTDNYTGNPDLINLHWGENSEVKMTDSEAVLSKYLTDNEVIHLAVDLQNGSCSEQSYGCDLTEEYVKIIAYYTT